jgi:hypothetical protein
MKNLKIKIAVVLFALVGLMSSCSKEDTPPQENLKSEQLKNDETSKVASQYTVGEYVFNRSNAVGGLGHVGVGFWIFETKPNGNIEQSWYIGGLENEGGSAIVAPGGQNGGWFRKVGSDRAMIRIMKEVYGYDFSVYRQVSPNLNRINNARSILSDLPRRGYTLFGNNCMNATFDVLNAFGGGLSWPSIPSNYGPNAWFRKLKTSDGWDQVRRL